MVEVPTKLPAARDWLVSFSLTIVLVLALYAFIEPRWETNDDIAMSMVAHGYGIAAAASPQLVFSNVLWGYFVQSLPYVFGVPGYSVATLLVLVISAAILVFGLIRTGAGWVLCVCLLVSIFTRPFVFPQFTLNSGLLFVSSFACISIYARTGNKICLVLAGLIAFASYIIRSQEFLLLLIVSLPLVPWKELKENKEGVLFIASISMAIAAAYYFNDTVYSSNDWKYFSESNPIRALFTDFHIGGLIKENVSLMQKYGFTSNDIDLISNFYFADKSVMDIEALGKLIRDMGPMEIWSNAFANGKRGMVSLMDVRLLPVMFAAVVVLGLRFCWRAVFAWAIGLTAVFALSAFGRFGVLRVYEPIFVLMLVAPFFVSEKRFGPTWLPALCLLFVSAFTLVQVTASSKSQQALVESKRAGVSNLPHSTIVLWGDGFSLAAAYPVLDRVNHKLPLTLYPLGVFTWAPFSVSFLHEKEGRGLSALLRSEQGAWFVASRQRLDYLRIYCSEHFGGSLRQLANSQFGAIEITRQQCGLE